MRQWRHYPAVYDADRIDPGIPLTPWTGHRPFAYDYIRNVQPRRVVELGTHTGCSFFSFCQAVKDGGMNGTSLHAVDTWKGDAHAGFYGEEVYETFLSVIKACYSSLSITPWRKKFIEALDDIADASVDLIHIDGFHTYEAVEEDYRTWLPKLCPDGVFFFHDVHAKEYESTLFWRELANRNPAFVFEHSYGLGLLFPKGDRLHRFLVRQGLPQLAPFYTRIGLLEMELAQSRADAQKRVEAETGARARVLEERLRQAEAETARQREETNTWRQAALDSQWLIDSLKGDGCSTD